MEMNTKLIFDKNTENEESQIIYESIISLNILLGMSGLNYIDSSFIDCGDTIELNIKYKFNFKDIEKLKDTFTQMNNNLNSFLST